MTKKCICEICTCGRHRCPHRPNVPLGRGDASCPLSEYTTTYRQHPIHPRENFKPKQEVKADGGPMEDKTTHRVDYIPHSVERPQFHQPDPYKKPQGEIDTLTSYVKDYPAKRVDPAKLIKHESRPQVGSKFEGIPTYTTDYRKWDIPPPHRAGDPATWQPPKQPFEGETTFHRDFKGHVQAPRKSMKPSEAARTSDAPFDDLTGYREYYIRHPLPDRFEKKAEVYKPSCVPFDGLSTFKKDYTGKWAPKIDSCKPDNKAFQSSEPLDGTTTAKNDFRRWEVERPTFHQPDVYKPPEGDMERDTTHKLAYRQHPMQPHTLVKPPNAGVLRPGHFDGVTNYTTDYKPWDLSCRPKPMMLPDYKPNQAPFEGLPTYKAHYIQHPLHPNKSCKPDSKPFQSDAQFDCGTMYRMDYTPKEIEPCPVVLFNTSAAKHTFVETDSRGHKVYKPVFETITDLGPSGRPLPPPAQQQRPHSGLKGAPVAVA